MSFTNNATVAASIIAAIIAAYVYARRAAKRQHEAKLASFSRKIEAAEQRDREQSS